MGTRIVYQIMNNGLVATLFSNSSHTTQFAEDVFDQALADPACSAGPSPLVEKLLSLRYLTAEGNHRINDRIFSLVPADEASDGDREVLVTAILEGVISEELAERESTPVGRWRKVRQEV